MQKLKIKTRTHTFIFNLHPKSTVITELSMMDGEEKKWLLTENRWTEFIKSDNLQVISLTTDDCDFIETVASWDFLDLYENTEGIDFCCSISYAEEEEKRLEKLRDARNEVWFTIWINFSELLELTLDGETLL